MSTMGLTKWNTETTTKFLSLYRDQECLWRNDLQEYRNKNARDTALKSIIAAMKLPGLTVDGVKKKIKYLRSTYMVEVNKVEKSIQSGSGTYKPCLSWFYEMDSFIKYVQSKRNTQSLLISQPISENEDTQEGINEKQLIELGSLDLHTEIFIKQEDEEQWNYDELAGQSDECIEAPTFDASREQLTSRCSKRNIENHIKQEDQEQWNDDKQAGQSDESIKATTVDTSKEQLTPRGSKRTHMNQLTSIVNDIKSISKENKEKEQNELDVFGKYVGLQLKSLQEEDAILAQEEIMSILTRYKLKKVRRRSISP